MSGLAEMLDANRETLSGGLLSDRVHQLLRAAILSGELAPGERIVESETARRLRISQAPVREAVKRLVHEGLLTHRPRLGSFVTEISDEQVAQARALRRVLEEFSARAAAEVRAAGYADRLAAIVEDMRQAADKNDLAAFRDSDMEFHRLVCHASGNHFLPKLWEVMEPSLRALRVVSDPGYSGPWTEVVDEHNRLLGLLLDGRADEAAVEFGRHAAGEAPIGEAKKRRKAS
jgi:DNA-binding GntR family transcriptional regulator